MGTTEVSYGNRYHQGETVMADGWMKKRDEINGKCTLRY